jgi:hypothetical protein
VVTREVEFPAAEVGDLLRSCQMFLALPQFLFAPAECVEILPEFFVGCDDLLVHRVEIHILPDQFLLDPVSLVGVPDRTHQRRTRDLSLYEVILGTIMKGERSGLLIVKSGEDNDREGGILDPDRPQRIDTLAVRQPKVEEDEVRITFCNEIQGSGKSPRVLQLE